LLLETAHAIDDSTLIGACEKIAVQMAEATHKGLSPEGGVYNEKREKSRGNPFSWWLQAEGVVGYFNAYQISGNEKYLDTACRMWNFIDQYFVDRKYGDWIYGLDNKLAPLPFLKVGFWKCPYHNSRMCLEIISRTENVGKKPK
jgi:mannobiose 2-epimerase